MDFDVKDPINLVFLHGWGMNKMVWQPFLQQSSIVRLSNLNTYTFDLPGFGENQHAISREQYSLTSVAHYVEEAIPANSVLVAWSLAGLVSQYLVNLKSPKVVAQIQVCSTPKFIQEGRWPGIKPVVLEQFAEQLTQDHHALLRRFLTIQCMGLDEPKVTYKTMNTALTSHPLSHPEALASSLNILMTTDLRDKALYSCPSLRVFGGLDSLVPKRAIPHIQEIFDGDQFHLIDKASHAPFISHPFEFEQVIERFLHNYCFDNLSTSNF